MNKVAEFLTQGAVTLKKVNSPTNGELTVKWDTLDGYTILGGGLWQVGGPVEGVWKIGLAKVSGDKFSKILILGLGGGTIAKLARKKWPDSKIVGVDIDPIIVKLGEDYLGLKKFNVEQHIEDAEQFIKKEKRHFDLICVDMYLGENYPEKFEDEKFIKNTKKLLTKDGVLAVNRLYFGKKRALAEKFLKLLKQNFTNVTEVYPKIEANVVYLARD